MSYSQGIGEESFDLGNAEPDRAVVALAGTCLHEKKNITYVAMGNRFIQQEKFSLSSEDEKAQLSAGDSLHVYTAASPTEAPSTHDPVRWAVLNCHEYTHVGLMTALIADRIEVLVVVTHNAATRLYWEYARSDVHRLFCYVIIVNSAELGGSAVFAPYRRLGTQRNAQFSASGQLFGTRGPVFNDSDLQMAGYAAALKVLTAYTHIGGEDVTTFALRPRGRGEVTVVDEIVQQAAETASSLLVPEGLAPDTWAKLTGIERFVLRMLDMETTGAQKLDNYQNFAKAFRVEDYSRVMGDMRPNHARLKRVTEFASRDLTESTEIGATKLGRLIIALQQMLKDTEPQVIVEQIKNEMADFLEVRPLLVDMLAFIQRKSPEAAVRSAAEVLGARLKNLRFGA
jgi:hypothetical protein